MCFVPVEITLTLAISSHFVIAMMAVHYILLILLQDTSILLKEQFKVLTRVISLTSQVSLIIQVFEQQWVVL